MKSGLATAQLLRFQRHAASVCRYATLVPFILAALSSGPAREGRASSRQQRSSPIFTKPPQIALVSLLSKEGLPLCSLAFCAKQNPLAEPFRLIVDVVGKRFDPAFPEAGVQDG